VRENPPKIEWKDIVDWPAFEVSPEHAACQSLGAAYQRDCGVDAISAGPGDISMGAHRPDEYLPLLQFKTAAKTHTSVTLDWYRYPADGGR